MPLGKMPGETLRQLNDMRKRMQRPGWRNAIGEDEGLSELEKRVMIAEQREDTQLKLNQAQAKLSRKHTMEIVLRQGKVCCL